MFDVTENMLFSLNKSSTHRLPLQNAIRMQVISYFWKNLQEISVGTYLTDTESIEKESRFGIINFWLVVIPVERFLGRGGSWSLVVARRFDRL